MYHIRYAHTQLEIASFEKTDTPGMVAWFKERAARREPRSRTGEVHIIPRPGADVVGVKVYDGAKLMRLEDLYRLGAVARP